MKFSAAALFALVGAAFAAPLTDDEPRPLTGGPDPTKVNIGEVGYGGNGCPQGTVTTIMNNDKSAFTLLMSDYIAEIGPGVSASKWTRNCALNIKLNYPGGFQFSVFQVTYRGTAILDKGITGTQTAQYFFTGAGQLGATYSSRVQGPYDGLYKLTDSIGVGSTVWSPCGGSGRLNINSGVRLSRAAGSQGSGVLTTETIDLGVQQIWAVVWRRC